VEGFKSQVGHLIRYQSEVLEIRLVEDAVEVTYREARSGRQRRIRADYCVSNIPLPVLHTSRSRSAACDP
jgi:monoamine oxidase